MESQAPIEPQAVQQKESLFTAHRKAIIIGGGIAIVLVVFISMFFLLRPKVPTNPVQPTSKIQSTANQPQVLVVSDVPNITLTKVNNTALTNVLADSHTFFQPNIHVVTFHLTNVLLSNPTTYMQRFTDSTHKIILGGFYETTTPSTASEDVYIYNGQTASSTSNAVISAQFWNYTLSSIWYLANIQGYKSTDAAQLATLSEEQYKFMQAHAINPITITVQ